MKLGCTVSRRGYKSDPKATVSARKKNRDPQIGCYMGVCVHGASRTGRSPEARDRTSTRSEFVSKKPLPAPNQAATSAPKEAGLTLKNCQPPNAQYKC